jgi:hypothetical protein
MANFRVLPLSIHFHIEVGDFDVGTENRPDHQKSYGNTYKEITMMIYDILNTLPRKE